MEGGGSDTKPRSFRVLPDTCVELFINFGGQHEHPFQIGEENIRDRSFITSRMSRFMDVVDSGPLGFITLCFFPGKAWPFFGLPMKELSNQVVSLEHIWGPMAAEMNETIDSSTSTVGRVQFVQELLLEFLVKNFRVERSFDVSFQYINQTHGTESMEEVARKTGLSCRQMARMFNRHIGISPKEFARMIRFLHSLDLLKKNQLSLSEVAYEAGFYDQAHFIHETKSFAGLTPHEIRSSVHVLY